MFTDWTQTDPHYFYIRGVIFGVVITLNIVYVIYRLKKRKSN